MAVLQKKGITYCLRSSAKLKWGYKMCLTASEDHILESWAFCETLLLKIIRGTPSGLSLETLIALIGIHTSDEIGCVKMSKDELRRTFQSAYVSETWWKQPPKHWITPEAPLKKGCFCTNKKCFWHSWKCTWLPPKCLLPSNIAVCQRDCWQPLSKHCVTALAR